MNMPIAVLGAGSWGTALAIVLARNGYDVRLWSNSHKIFQSLKQEHINHHYLPGIILPSNILPYTDLAETVADINDILLVVPSSAFRATLQKLKPFIHSQTRIAWGTKGLDDNGKLLSETVQEVLSNSSNNQAPVSPVPMAIISGPTFAREVAIGLPTALTIAANDTNFAADCASYLHSKTFRVYTSNDLIGVQVGGAVKNVLAIATGIADGMGFGANARCAIITRGLAELTRLGISLGGKMETFMGLAGLGDLVLTCTDDQSRNRRFGLALGKGADIATAENTINQVVEGIHNAELIYNLAKRISVEMPIVEQIYKILYENLCPKEAVNSLLSREPKVES